jgi:hypothetical protein
LEDVIVKDLKKYFWHTGRELRIPVARVERALYRATDPPCKYHSVRWPIRRGRGKFGENTFETLVILFLHLSRCFRTTKASFAFRIPENDALVI